MTGFKKLYRSLTQENIISAALIYCLCATATECVISTLLLHNLQTSDLGRGESLILPLP